MTITYLGDENSHSYAAAAAVAGDKVGKTSIRSVIRAVAAEQADECVVPIENSIEGTVNECVDTLLGAGLYIKREILLPIHECLIGKAGAKKEDLKIVYSHPQALSQCRKYLEKNFMHVTVEALSSTSAALQKVTDVSVGAIARRPSAGLEVLESDIEDYENNTTRFVVLSRTPSYEGEKVSVVFDTANEPGALLSVLEVFKENRLNLTKIESRPGKSGLGHYIFYVDFLMKGGKDELFDIMTKLGKRTSFLKFLGKYERSK